MDRIYDNIIIFAHARDETVFFFDHINPRSILILLSTPKKYYLDILIDISIKVGCVLVRIDEPETFNPKYTLSIKAKDIIEHFITEYRYNKIITQHHNFLHNDPQNRQIALFINSLDVVKQKHFFISPKQSAKRSINTNRYLCKERRAFLLRYAAFLKKRIYRDNEYKMFINIMNQYDGLTRY